jgi:hypothetical protein
LLNNAFNKNHQRRAPTPIAPTTLGVAPTTR